MDTTIMHFCQAFQFSCVISTFNDMEDEINKGIFNAHACEDRGMNPPCKIPPIPLSKERGLKKYFNVNLILRKGRLWNEQIDMSWNIFKFLVSICIKHQSFRYLIPWFASSSAYPLFSHNTLK